MKTGDQVGKWTLVEELGQGGNSTVWRAKGAFKTDVAIKFLTRFNRYDRFRDEVGFQKQESGRPGILPLLDAYLPDSPSKSDRAWLVTPVSVGLREYVEEQGDQFVAAVECIRDAARVLAGLHAEGTAHRDVKPENLFVYNDRTVLGDFGLVTFPSKEAITVAGERLGPIYYVAPELLGNEDGPDDCRPGDVYSLAKTLWVLGSGQKFPLPGQLTRHFEPFQISRWVPDQRAWMLEEVLERATDPDPSARPTMEQFASELEDHCSSRDLRRSPIAIPGIGHELRGNLVRLKSEAEETEARLREFAERIGGELNAFASQLGSSLASELGTEFVQVESNPNMLYVQQAANDLVQGTRCAGTVTIWGGKVHKGNTKQFVAGIVACADDSFNSIRVVAGQMCCRHSDSRKRWLWRDERIVPGSLAKCLSAIDELVLSVEENLHIGLDMFRNTTK